MFEVGFPGLMLGFLWFGCLVVWVLVSACSRLEFVDFGIRVYDFGV